MRNIGFLTIGQAPRPDLSAGIEAALPATARVRHAGVLDGPDPAREAERLAAVPGRPTLITRLATGATVTLDEAAVGEALQARVDALEGEGVDAVVLLCTGEFPALRARRALLVEPDVLLTTYVRGVLSGVQVGVIVPLPEQVAAARDKWRDVTPTPEFATASPYAADETELLGAARELVGQGVEALVLDCMGYAEWHREALRAGGVRVPVLTSSGVTGAMTGPLLA
ncbi:AroM family protein [Streptomyces sp. NPDC002795]|uniref:AroM family protein n=1 Tax=Streptomyces sp. NPDC002795 TaxID=3364665 RepID=UPI003685B058